jgi:hypothetical protein
MQEEHPSTSKSSCKEEWENKRSTSVTLRAMKETLILLTPTVQTLSATTSKVAVTTSLPRTVNSMRNLTATGTMAKDKTTVQTQYE